MKTEVCGCCKENIDKPVFFQVVKQESEKENTITTYFLCENCFNLMLKPPFSEIEPRYVTGIEIK